MSGLTLKGSAGARAALSLLATVTLLLCGCGAAPSVARAGASTATPAPPIVSTTQAYPPPTRSFQQAWGAAPITRLPMGLSNDQRVFEFLSAATPDGQWLIGEVAARDYANASNVIPYLAAYNVRTRQIAPIHNLATAKSGISIVATDGTWFVWQEVSGNQDGQTDGIIRIVNWKTGVYRQYTQAMLSGLVVEDGRAIWSQTMPNEPGASAAAQTAVVRLADLNAGKVTTLATDATGAALAWPWAGWGVQTDTAGNGYLQFTNLVTGQTTRSAPITGQTTIQSLAGALRLHGVTAVFTMDFGNQVDEIPDVARSTKPQTIYYNAANGMGGGLMPGLGPVSTDGRLIAWDTASASPIPLVWDSAERALVTLPTTSGETYLAWAGADLLVWYDPVSHAQQQADQAAGRQSLATLCVVETSALPA